MTADVRAGRERARTEAVDRNTAALGEYVADRKADIVACAVIPRPDVAEKDDHPFGAAGGRTKQHRDILLEQRGDGNFLVDAANGFGEETVHGDIVDLLETRLADGIGDRVAELQLLDGAFLNALERRAGRTPCVAQA